MTTALRPMSTGEVLDRTFFLYRNHFVLFFGIATLPPALMLLMQIIILAVNGGVAKPNAQPLSREAIAGGVAVAFIAIAVYLIGYAMAQAATVYAVSAVHLDRTMTIREAYSRVRGRYGRVLGIILLIVVIVFLAALVVVFAIGVASALVPLLGAAMGMGGYILGGVLALAVTVAGILFFIGVFVRYSLAICAGVLEDAKIWAAMKRSVFLAKGSRARIVAIYFLVTVLNFVVTWAVLIPFVVMNLQHKGVAPSAFWAITQNVVSSIVTAVLSPILTVAIALVYYDERVRKEAFDIQLMMTALDGPQPAASGAPAGSIG